MSISIKKFTFIFCNIGLLIIFILISCIVYNYDYATKNWAAVVSTIAIVEIIAQISQMLILNIDVIDFRVVFIVLHYLFMFGRVFIYGYLPKMDVFWDQRYRYQSSALLLSGLYCICAIQGLFLGLLFGFSDKTSDSQISNEFGNSKSKTIYFAGIVCLLIGLPCSLITDRARIITTYYSNTYRSIDVGLGIIDDLASLFIVGIILLLSSNCLKKKSEKFISLLTIIYYIFVMMFSGDRRHQITAILVLVVLCCKKYELLKRMRITTYILLGIFSIIMLNFIYIIRDFRDTSLQSIFPYISENFMELFSLNAVKETLIEFGISFYSICNVIKYVPSTISFQYGKGFISALLSLLPTGLMKNGELMDTQISLSALINKMEGNPVGASLIGDFYINFGFLGCVLIVIFGRIMDRIMRKRSKLGSEWSVARYYILYYVFLTLVRATFAQCIRMTVVNVIFPMFIIGVVDKLGNKYVKSIN